MSRRAAPGQKPRIYHNNIPCFYRISSGGRAVFYLSFHVFPVAKPLPRFANMFLACNMLPNKRVRRLPLSAVRPRIRVLIEQGRPQLQPERRNRLQASSWRRHDGLALFRVFGRGRPFFVGISIHLETVAFRVLAKPNW